MGGGEVGWVEGTLRIEVVGDGEGVVVEVLGDLGGVRERLFPLLKMGAPFKEFARMVDHMPRTLEPLVVVNKAANRVVLEALSDGPLTATMPQVAIADDSLYRGRRTTRPKVGPKDSIPVADHGSKPSGSSSKFRAARRASIPVEMPAHVPARTGTTLRPALVGAPAPTRSRTLMPDNHAVPPPIPAVPQAPRIPRVDPDEPSAPKTERLRGRRAAPQPDRPAAPARASTSPSKAAATGHSGAPPRGRRGSKPKVDKRDDSLPPASTSSAKLRAARKDSTADDLDWEMPAIDTVLPPTSGRGDTLLPSDDDDDGRGDTLLPSDHGVPPPVPVVPPTRLPQVTSDARTKSRSMKATATAKVARGSSAKNPRTRSITPRPDPRADEDEGSDD
jgi:hypothetical protein